MKHTHEEPIPDGEEPCERIERNVASRAFRIVVWASQLGTAAVETSSSDEGGSGLSADGGAGQHPMNRQMSQLGSLRLSRRLTLRGFESSWDVFCVCVGGEMGCGYSFEVS